MDIRELEIFLVVAEQLHFGRASRMCGLSPSALTRTIQRLEDQVERELFVRNRRSVRLSAVGEQFYQYAREAVQQWYSFKQIIREEQSIAGSLSIYASLTAVYSILPRVLENYRQRYPKVQLELTTGAAEQALSLLSSGEIDLVVAAVPTSKRAQLNILPLLTTPLVFIAPAQIDPALDPRNAGQLDLSVAPLVLPQQGLSRERVDQWFRSNQVTPNISSEVSGNEALISLVSLGGGIGVVPQLVWESSPLRPKVRVINDAPKLEAYEVALCCNRQSLLVPSVRSFWELAQQRHDLVTI
ncbi:MAG: HTH-type transcriptional activator IlvY [Desulfuromonas sp.]|nr:HTH-type transcriptional activator IlvY [Desulfuromonas sp.]